MITLTNLILRCKAGTVAKAKGLPIRNMSGSDDFGHSLLAVVIGPFFAKSNIIVFAPFYR